MMKHFLSGLACLTLSACGAYFVTTGDLQTQHDEDIIPPGGWVMDSLQIILSDGPDTHDRLCAVEDDFQLWANAYALPVAEGTLILLSDLTFYDVAGVQTVDGSLIYGLIENEGQLTLVDTFKEIRGGDTLPFASACQVSAPQNTLAEANFTPFCMWPSVTKEEIAAWMRKHTPAELEPLRPLSESDMPSFCLQD